MATALLAASAPMKNDAVAAGLGAFNTFTECSPSTNENGFSIANENSIFRGGIDLGGLLCFMAEFPGMYAKSGQKGPHNIFLIAYASREIRRQAAANGNAGSRRVSKIMAAGKLIQKIRLRSVFSIPGPSNLMK